MWVVPWMYECGGVFKRTRLRQALPFLARGTFWSDSHKSGLASLSGATACDGFLPSRVPATCSTSECSTCEPCNRKHDKDPMLRPCVLRSITTVAASAVVVVEPHDPDGMVLTEGH